MVHQGVKEALEAFVKKGGVLVTGFMSGIVGESDNVYLGGYPGPLRDLAGIWVEEIDALAPEQKNSVKFKDGTEFTSTMLCDLIHLEGAESMADYSSNFYAVHLLSPKTVMEKVLFIIWGLSQRTVRLQG